MFLEKTGAACGTRDTRRGVFFLLLYLAARRRVARGLRAVPSLRTAFQPPTPSYWNPEGVGG